MMRSALCLAGPERQPGCFSRQINNLERRSGSMGRARAVEHGSLPAHGGVPSATAATSNPVSALVVAFCLALSGCHASASAEAKTSSDEKVAEYDRPFEPSDGPSGFGDTDEATDMQMALVGARHDLLLSTDAPSAVCQCLDIVAGPATSPDFFWQAGPPQTNSSTQIVVALTSEGIPCPDAPAESLGASYWGYEVEGENTVVVVELARPGRPLTSGAIIPRPGPQGHILVKPLNKRVPYGRPLTEGQPRCEVPIPGGAADSN